MKRLFLAAVLTLIPAAARADTFEVSFQAIIGFPSGDVAGSFLWNTATGTLSDPNIHDEFGNSYSEQILAPMFAPANNGYNYPEGSLIFFVFADPLHPANNINFASQNHAYLDAPVLPQPGTYQAGGLFYWNSNPSSDAWITVAPVAAAEPATITMFVAGLLLAALKRKGT